MTITFTRRRVIACMSVLAFAVGLPIVLRAASRPSTLESEEGPAMARPSSGPAPTEPEL